MNGSANTENMVVHVLWRVSVDGTMHCTNTQERAAIARVCKTTSLLSATDGQTNTGALKAKRNMVIQVTSRGSVRGSDARTRPRTNQMCSTPGLILSGASGAMLGFAPRVGPAPRKYSSLAEFPRSPNESLIA